MVTFVRYSIFKIVHFAEKCHCKKICLEGGISQGLSHSGKSATFKFIENI